MHTSRKVLALIASAVATWVYATALHEVFVRDSRSIVATSYGGHLQFLTILSLVASLIHSVLAVLSLLTGLRTLNALQSWVLTVSAPLEVVVAALYWPLKFYNNDLVKDKRFGLKIDPELDRKCHLYPAILEFLSATVLAQRPWRAGVFGPLVVFSAVGVGYWAWVEHTATYNGFYPYPLLAILSPQEKGYLVSGAVVVAFITFKIIQGFQRLLS